MKKGTCTKTKLVEKEMKRQVLSLMVGVGEDRGREVYGRWDNRGWEVGYPRGQEPGEVINILQHWHKILQ